MLAGKFYLRHHNLICTYIHWAVVKDLGGTVPDSWMLHKPQQSTVCGQVTVTYDMPVLTDKNVHHNKPDLVVWNKAERTAQIIDVAVPMDRNVIRKNADKIITIGI